LSLWFFARVFASFMSDKMVFRMNVRKEVEVVRGSNGKRVCNNVTEDMTFLHLSITRFWTKDLRISEGRIG